MSLVKLIVESSSRTMAHIDPACGSGVMFVHSAAFVETTGPPGSEISIYGRENGETVRLCKMNLAVHGLADSGRATPTTRTSIPARSFDFVMAIRRST